MGCHAHNNLEEGPGTGRRKGKHIMSAAESPQPVLPTAPAVVRERPGGETMRAIVLEKFGGLDSLVYTDIPKPQPRRRCGDRDQGVRHQPRRDAHAARRMGGGRRGERHRMRRHREVVSGRRVPGRCQSGGADGRPRADHQRKLRRVHPRARGQRRAHRIRPALGRVRGDSGNLCDRLDVSLPQPRNCPPGKPW